MGVRISFSVNDGGIKGDVTVLNVDLSRNVGPFFGPLFLDVELFCSSYDFCIFGSCIQGSK